MATGSLGQGLPIAVGVALAGKRLDRLPYRVWALCGDSEMAEGSMWEAFEHASYGKLDNLIAIIDVNRLGQRGETMHGWDLESYVRRAEAFGCHAIAIDGHDVDAIDKAYAEALQVDGQPTVIVAKTLKGKGVAAVENKDGAHGKALDDPEAAISELGGLRDLKVDVAKPERAEPHVFATSALELPTYEVGEEVATRKAYGDALAALGDADGKVVALDGEVSNSTYAEIFAKAHPERFFEMYIAEQQLVAAAVGMQVRGWKPFASSFAAFFTRAYDFIRMAAVSRATIAISGSHAGVSIGEDGPSQMALEDLAMMRAVSGSTVLYPCDANQTAKLVAAMAEREGISYLRTTRGATAGHLRGRRGLRRRRQPGRPCHRRGRRHDRGRGHHRPRSPFRVSDPCGRGDLGARRRLLLGEADRRRGPDGRSRGDRSHPHRRGPLARGRARGSRARRARRPRRAPAGRDPGSLGDARLGQARRAPRRRRHRRRAHRGRGPQAGTRRRATVGVETSPTGKDGTT